MRLWDTCSVLWTSYSSTATCLKGGKQWVSCMFKLNIITRLSSLHWPLLSCFRSPCPLLFTTCKPQGHAVGSGWNQLNVYRVYPRKNPWVIVMAILIILTGCRCGWPGQSENASYPPASATAWGKWGLITIFFFFLHSLYTQKKSNISSRVRKKKLCKDWMSHW